MLWAVGGIAQASLSCAGQTGVRGRPSHVVIRVLLSTCCLWASNGLVTNFLKRRSLLWELPQGGDCDSQPGGVAAAGAAGHCKDPADNPAAAPRCNHRPWHHPGALIRWHSYKPTHRCDTASAQHLCSLQRASALCATMPYCLRIQGHENSLTWHVFLSSFLSPQHASLLVGSSDVT